MSLLLAASTVTAGYIHKVKQRVKMDTSSNSTQVMKGIASSAQNDVDFYKNVDIKKTPNIESKAKDLVSKNNSESVADVKSNQTPSNKKSNEVNLSGTTYDIVTIKGAFGALFALKSKDDFKYLMKEYLEVGIDAVFSGLNKIITDSPTAIDEDKYVSENFYKGHQTFLDAAPKSSRWRLGYSQESIVPDNFYTSTYYMGGYLTIPATKAKTIEDDIKVRTVVIDDKTGRGKVAISVLDSIGLSNTDVRSIRAALAEYAKENNIVSINVLATHNHSAIDTMGLWGSLPEAIVYNVLSSRKGSEKSISGFSDYYKNIIINKTVKSVRDATEKMETGEFLYSKTDISDYLSDKRDPYCVIGDMNRLRFVPDNKESKPTMLVNVSSHPNVSGLKTEDGTGDFVTGEYVYYMEEVINSQGYNMLFLQGAIGGHVDPSRGLSSDGLPLERRHDQQIRYGRELGRIASAMTMTTEEIEKSSLVDFEEIEREKALSNDYTLWYKDWKAEKEDRVDSYLNIRAAEIMVNIENPIIKALSKLRLVQNLIIKGNDGNTKTVTEISYMEMGKLKFVLQPGEMSPEIVIGGDSLKAEHSHSRTDFGFPTMNEIVSGELIVLGIANDMVGYIVPDNDYCMIIAFDHYEETLSFNPKFASTLVTEFKKIVDEVK